MEIINDPIPLGASPTYDVREDDQFFFIQPDHSIGKHTHADGIIVTIPLLSITNAVSKPLIKSLKEFCPDAKVLLSIRCAIDKDPNNIGIGLAVIK